MARAELVGLAASPGVGVGHVLLVHGDAGDEPAAAPAGLRGQGDPALEADRFRVAVEATTAELEELGVRTAAIVGEEVAAIFAAQAVLARDPAIATPALAAIASGVLADEAVLAAATAQAEKLAALDDPYFRSRAADVLDVGRRIAARLAGRGSALLGHVDGTPAVLVADDLAPSELATLQEELVAGLALAGGAATGHAAIIARALGLPLVLGLGAGVLELAHGTVVAVDGSGGRVLVEPGEGEIEALTSARRETVRGIRA